MLDLDAIEARVDAHADTVEDVRALVAELRAARQQLDEYEHLRSTLVTRFNLGSALRPALVAEWVIHIYDKAVG